MAGQSVHSAEIDLKKQAIMNTKKYIVDLKENPKQRNRAGVKEIFAVSNNNFIFVL